jgi:hypothetical protein
MQLKLRQPVMNQLIEKSSLSIDLVNGWTVGGE